MSANDRSSYLSGNDPLALSSLLYEPKRYHVPDTEPVCTCKAKASACTLNHKTFCAVYTEAAARLCIGKGGTRP